MEWVSCTSLCCQEEWDQGDFRDCNGVSNGTPLPYHVMKYEAQLYPYHGKPAGLVGPPPNKPSYKPSYKPSKKKQKKNKKSKKSKKHPKSKIKSHGHHKMPTSFLEAPRFSNHREDLGPQQFISKDSSEPTSAENFSMSNLPRSILTFLTRKLSEIH